MSMLGRESPDERDERLGGSRMVTAARKEENIYIPQFITKRPFYTIDESDESAALDSSSGPPGAGGDAAAAAAAATGRKSASRDYLEHQRLRKTAPEDPKWYQRGRTTTGPAATKYRKGACENCGSMGHKMRDCLSRPRAKLAKYTGEDIQADRAAEDVRLGYDAKRDRWMSFDPRDYAAMMAQRERLQEARRVLLDKAAGPDAAPAAPAAETGPDDGSGSSSSRREDTRYAEDADMGVSRNNGTADLRMREDTAQYLINLDLDSASYDPKRRKIVSGGAYLDESARLFAEENFAKASGDAASFEQAERYAWEVHDKTGDASLHLQANPTYAAHRRKTESEEARKRQKELDDLMREKYGIEPPGGAGAAADETTTTTTTTTTTKRPPPPAAALLATAVASSEKYVEYDETGHVKEKIQPKRADKSKYEEDVFPLNHTAIWGSWWHSFQWGYACCHSFVRNSYCTGEEGKLAWERAERQRLGDWGDDGPDGADADADADGGTDRRERRLLTERGEDDGGGSESRRRETSPSKRRRTDRGARTDS